MVQSGYMKRKSTASSPSFTYSVGTTINIDYMLRQSSTDSLVIYILHATSHLKTLIWKSTEYSMFGVFQSCITLPDDLAMTEIHLVLEFVTGDVLWYEESNIYTSFREITFTQDTCPGENGLIY